MGKGISRKKIIAKGGPVGGGGGAGSVTQVDTDTTLTGGPITTSGILGVNEAADFNWTGDHSFTESVIGKGGVFTLGNEFVDKNYVDAIAQGLIPLLAVDLASTANSDLTGEEVMDGTLTSASRVLLKDQTDPIENGIWITGAAGWTRATDYDDDAEVLRGTFVPVISGTANAGSLWVQVQDAVVVDTDPIVFTQLNPVVSPTASLGVQKVGNDFRANLDNLTLTLTGNQIQFSGGTDHVSNQSNVLGGGGTTTDALNELDTIKSTVTTGAANQVAVFDGVNSIAGSNNFVYNSGNFNIGDPATAFEIRHSSDRLDILDPTTENFGISLIGANYPGGTPTVTGLLVEQTGRYITLGNGSTTRFIVDVDNSEYLFSDPNINIDSVPYVFPNAQGAAGTYLQNDGSGNLSWSSGSATPVLTSNVRYVAKNGDNGTAAANDLTRPYLTIAAALTAASAGETIVVYPGSYTETTGLTLKDGVNFHFIGKGGLTTSAGNGIFIGASNVTSNIYAPGWTFTATAGRYNFYSVGTTAVNVQFTFERLISANSPNFYLDHSSSNIYVKGNSVLSTAGWANIYGESNLGGSNHYMSIDRMEVNAVGARNVDLQEGNLHLINKQAVSTNGGCIYIQASNAGCKMFFQMGEILASGGVWPVWFAGTSTRMFITFDSIVSPSDCHIVSGDGGVAYAQGKRIHSTMNGTQDGIVHAESGGTLYVFDVHITREATAINGGDIKLTGATSEIYLKNVTYDITKTKLSGGGLASNMFRWNGTSYVTVPEILNNPDGSLNAITTCELGEGVTVDFATFTGCTLSNVRAANTTFTFTANSQTISDREYTHGALVPYKITMVVTQDGTATPPVIDRLINNNTGGTLSWTYVGAGNYTLDSTTPIFLIGNYSVYVDFPLLDPLGPSYVRWTHSSATSLAFLFVSGGAGTDGLMTSANIDINLYNLQ